MHDPYTRRDIASLSASHNECEDVPLVSTSHQSQAPESRSQLSPWPAAAASQDAIVPSLPSPSRRAQPSRASSSRSSTSAVRRCPQQQQQQGERPARVSSPYSSTLLVSSRHYRLLAQPCPRSLSLFRLFRRYSLLKAAAGANATQTRSGMRRDASLAGCRANLYFGRGEGRGRYSTIALYIFYNIHSHHD